MTSPQEFNRIRIAFMQRVSAPSIPAVAFKLGWLIAFKYMNCKTGVAYPPQTTLAADLGASVRTVQRLLDILERHGLKIIPGDSRGRASTYWIDPERVSPVSPFTAKKGCHPCRLKGVTHVAPTNKDTTNKKESASHSPKKAAQARPRGRTPLPENWHPELAGQEEFERFCDHARANARTYADWEAAWRNWQRSPYRNKGAGNGNGRRHGSVLDAFDRLGEKLHAQGSFADQYIPGSSGPTPLRLDQEKRPANLKLIPKG